LSLNDPATLQVCSVSAEQAGNSKASGVRHLYRSNVIASRLNHSETLRRGKAR
jgi:hypothetical protein